jgi:hypothetical protein
MSGNSTVMSEVNAFIAQWQAGDVRMRRSFEELFQYITDLENVAIAFAARPGISYSLRPKHANQTERDLFAIIDVIDDNPEERWLSVCFYGDMITDPEERGEVIPGGLAGSDGYCFDMYEGDGDLTNYLKERLQEACRKASL